MDYKNLLIAGGSGFLGSHLQNAIHNDDSVRNWKVTAPRSKKFDFRNLTDAIEALKNQDIVINLAANVGGIGYNQAYPGKLFYDNITIGVNLLEAARICDVSKVVQIGTVCSYPKITNTPFKEEDLWLGFPEETNAPYGIAKKALIVMGDSYSKQYDMNIISLLIVNLYGPGDNFNLEQSHVIPALIRKFVEAKENNSPNVTLWGSGNASREFLYVKDAADGIMKATRFYDKTFPINLGSGKEITIKDLSKKIAGIVGFDGNIEWDTSRPDGQPRRVLDVSKAKSEFGFEAKTDFENGLSETINWFRQNGR